MKAFTGDTLISDDIQTIITSLNNWNVKSLRVLVTGGAGFLGSWLCESLIIAGADVICIDDLSSGCEAHITNLMSSENFTFIKANVSEPFDFKGDLDIVIHMASRASPLEFEHYPLEILLSNTVGTLNALEIARRKNAKFLFTSTSETYGNPAVVPTPETYFGNVNCVGIRGCYDEGKRCGEAYVMAYKRQFNLDIRIARIFNTYGPRMRGDGIYARALPKFISQAIEGVPITVYGDGKQTRSFCYISDQISGLLKLATFPRASGEIINIGNDREISILELAKKIKTMVGSKSEITFSALPPDDPLRRRPDISKAEEVLNWQPNMAMEEGLSKTIKWSVKNTCGD